MLEESDYSDQDEYIEFQDQSCLCLFCDRIDSNATQCINHIREAHSIDLKQLLGSRNFYDSIKIINYLRSNPDNLLKLNNNDGEWTDDKYLIPVMENDALLGAFEDDFEDFSDPDMEFSHYQCQSAHISVESQELISKVQNTNLDDDDRVPAQDDEIMDYYFDSYSGVQIHKEMLQDQVRTDAYRDFIYDNKHLFRDKVVLDVGCGTGILSMFCAKAGAKLVFGVDASNMARVASQVVKQNGLSNTVKIIRGKVEDLPLLHGGLDADGNELLIDKVDIIVSEWMGYGLLFEGMLDSVLLARDKFLKPGGLMVPQVAKVYIGAIQDDDLLNDSRGFWSNVYGFDMTSVYDYSTKRSDQMESAQVESVGRGCLLSNSQCIQEIDCQTVTVPELDFTSQCSLEIKRDGQLQALCLWFDCIFDDNRQSSSRIRQVLLHTSPDNQQTHWHQTVLNLPEPVPVKFGDVINADITINKDPSNGRNLIIRVDSNTMRGETSIHQLNQVYKLS
ncbi:hypothetical protein MIR68_010722 [Amoeboaphelidium protococcarum]|nr:hypothetical protein MIR68_010722 [Amoeboaphelidium protococcarum]